MSCYFYYLNKGCFYCFAASASTAGVFCIFSMIYRGCAPAMIAAVRRNAKSNRTIKKRADADSCKAAGVMRRARLADVVHMFKVSVLRGVQKCYNTW